MYFHNVTVRDLARVVGSREYKHLMARLAAAPKVKPSSDFAEQRWYHGDSELGIAINTVRRLLFGEPAYETPPETTQDLSALRHVLYDLKVATEAQLVIVLDKVVVTYPEFGTLHVQDTGHAISDAGLESWLHVPSDPFTLSYITTSKAVFAGHGLAPPEHFDLQPRYYMNPSQPRAYYISEEALFEYGLDSFNEVYLEEPPEETVYMVSLTSHALYTSLSSYQRPFGYPREYEYYTFDQSAGFENIGSFRDEAVYWTYVSGKLVPHNVENHITRVFVVGGAAGHPGFHEALRSALKDTSVSAEALASAWSTKCRDALYVAARGAALYARWRQENFLACDEPSDCEPNREIKRARLIEVEALGRDEL